MQELVETVKSTESEERDLSSLLFTARSDPVGPHITDDILPSFLRSFLVGMYTKLSEVSRGHARGSHLAVLILLHNISLMPLMGIR